MDAVRRSVSTVWPTQGDLQKPACRRVGSFADMDSLKRSESIVAPRPVKVRRAQEAHLFDLQHAFYDHDFRCAQNEILEILSQESDIDTDHSSRSFSTSPASSNGSPIEITARRRCPEVHLAASPPCRAKNPVPNNLPFRSPERAEPFRPHANFDAQRALFQSNFGHPYDH